MEVQRVKSVVVEYAYQDGRFVVVLPRPLGRRAYVVQYDRGAPFGWAVQPNGVIAIPMRDFAFLALSEKAIAGDVDTCIGEEGGEVYLLLRGKWAAKFANGELEFVAEDIDDYRSILAPPGKKEPALEELSKVGKLREECGALAI